MNNLDSPFKENIFQNKNMFTESFRSNGGSNQNSMKNSLNINPFNNEQNILRNNLNPKPTYNFYQNMSKNSNMQQTNIQNNSRNQNKILNCK